MKNGKCYKMDDITIMLETLQEMDIPDDKYDEVRDQLESILDFLAGE